MPLFCFGQDKQDTLRLSSLESMQYYSTKGSSFWEGREVFNLTYRLCYDDPNVWDEEMCHEIYFGIKKTLANSYSLQSDSITSYYRRKSVWSSTPDIKIQEGLITQIILKKNSISANIHATFKYKNEIIVLKGAKSFLKEK